jgi:peptidoglycan/LPS O-acetylase OafA/YrhL
LNASLQNLARSPSENNLNAIRLLLAILVIFSHSFALTGKIDPFFVYSEYQATCGELAVDLFFFISGVLITASWLNCKTMNEYMRRRVLRIFPGYIAALIFSFLVASAFASHPFGNLFRRLGNFSDVFSLGYSSSVGSWVFPNNPFPGVANGSLWTINQEFICYLLIAAIGLFGLFKRRSLILMLFILIFAVYVFDLSSGINIATSDRRFFTFFLAGTSVWLWRNAIPINNVMALLMLFITLLTTQYLPYFTMFAPLTVCYLVLWIGFAPPLKFFKWCDKTDLSYGVYLFAFPVQQILASAGIKEPWIMFIIAMPVTMGIAYLSWNLIEKPCLKLKSKDFSDYDPCHAFRVNQTSNLQTTKISW